MIGIHSRPDQARAVEELFELFKTPWETAVPGRRYRALVTTDEVPAVDADVKLVFSASLLAIDGRLGVKAQRQNDKAAATVGKVSFPIYRGAAAFPEESVDLLTVAGVAASCRRRSDDGSTVWRIGYDLFDEVQHLLTQGQPAEHAEIPTLDLHIDLLRQMLKRSGVPFVEIPPQPAGYSYVCCLTHDIDFAGIRRQGLGRALGGFVARATIGTFIDYVRGRRPLSDVLRNWTAVASLPLIALGLREDLWRPFRDYARGDEGLPSTFFLVPFKGRPGVAPNGHTDRTRAVSYQISDVRDEARQAASAGCELAVHGIDAWRDAAAGRQEMCEVAAVSGQSTTGIRMHWLYFDSNSPDVLEAAGYAYDSTWGYNDAIGYRAGTSQPFRLGDSDLMELPLAIMDSALFSSRRMNFAPDEAWDRCCAILANAGRFGGTVVVNWHCRSIAPERLWGAFYGRLLAGIRANGGPWFATAREAVDWFRWRRSIRFRRSAANSLTIELVAPPASGPPGIVRRHASGSETPDVVVAGDGRFDFRFADMEYA